MFRTLAEANNCSVQYLLQSTVIYMQSKPKDTFFYEIEKNDPIYCQ
jgi:hypothetical protein